MVNKLINKKVLPLNPVGPINVLNSLWRVKMISCQI